MGAYTRFVNYLNALIRARPYANPLAAMRSFADNLFTVVPGLTNGTTIQTSINPAPLTYSPTANGEKIGEIYVSSDRTPALAWIWTSTGWNGLSGEASGSTSYVLPTASAGTLGGIKIGAGLAIDGGGVLSAGATYVLPTATPSILGGIKVGTTLSIVAGVLDYNNPNPTPYVNPNPTPYVLPTASAGTLGGIKVGARLTMTGNVLSADVQSSAPAGANTQVIFNDAGAYAGNSGLTFDKTTGQLSVLGITNAVADGASAVAHVLDNSNLLLTTGSKLFSVRNGSIEQMWVTNTGAISWPGAGILNAANGGIQFNSRYAYATNIFAVNHDHTYGSGSEPVYLMRYSSGVYSTSIRGDLWVEGAYAAGVDVGTGTVFASRVAARSSGSLLLTSNSAPVYIGPAAGGSVWLTLFTPDLGVTNAAGIQSNGIFYGAGASTIAATPFTLSSAVADGGTAVVVDTSISMTIGTSKLFSIRNQNAEKAYVDLDGRYINVVGLYDDVQGPVAQAGGITALTFEAYRDTGYNAYFFKHNQDDKLYLSYQMPHSWDRGTVYPHIHITPMVNPATMEVIRFSGKYAWSQVGVELPADVSWTAFTADHTVNITDQFKQRVVPLATVAPPTSPLESNILLLWVQREASSVVDTYTTSKVLGTAAANVMVVSIDTHIQKVKFGTMTAIPV